MEVIIHAVVKPTHTVCYYNYFLSYRDTSLQHLHCVHTHSHIVACSLLFSVHCHHIWHYLYELVQYLDQNELIWVAQHLQTRTKCSLLFTKICAWIESHQWQDIQVVCRWLVHQVIPSNHHTQYPTLSSDISLPCPPSTWTHWLAAGHHHWNSLMPDNQQWMFSCLVC